MEDTRSAGGTGPTITHPSRATEANQPKICPLQNHLFGARCEGRDLTPSFLFSAKSSNDPFLHHEHELNQQKT